MKVALAAAFAVLLSSAALAQEDERVKRIVERIEKEIRDSHERTREEIRAIIRAELGKGDAPKPPDPPKPPPRPDPAPAVRKVYLGITAGDLSDAERKALGAGGGIKIAAVRGPAKDAGLKPDDVLVELDGDAVTEERIGGILARHKPGDSIDAVVIREKKRMTVKVVLAERKD
jgi:S1-C subfamily serine protease